MNLTQGQQEAMDTVARMQRERPEGGAVCVISGYAGTGKTTLLGALSEVYDSPFAVTPTGRAAVRVKEATGLKASTIHRWQYKPIEDQKTGQITFELRQVGDVQVPDCGFLIVDEASMVGFETFRNLYNFCSALGLNLVLVGDGFQLPPVETKEKNKTFSVFDIPTPYRVNLTEILRQALDSPIIRASVAVREGGWVNDALGDLPQVSSDRLVQAATEVFQEGGITICHRNITRNALNRDIREGLGYTGLPHKGEPLMVVKNNYALGVFNGEIFASKAEAETINSQSLAVRDAFTGGAGYINLLLTSIDTPSGGTREVVLVDKEVDGTLVNIGELPVRKTAGAYISRKYFDIALSVRPVHLNANYGYAMTCHKAQGSESDEVLVVIEPSIRLNTEDGRRHCYTAITRAKKRVSICWT